MTTLLEQIDAMRVRMNELGTQEHGLVETLGEALAAVDQRLPSWESCNCWHGAWARCPGRGNRSPSSRTLRSKSGRTGRSRFRNSGR